jgi:arsenate reductase
MNQKIKDYIGSLDTRSIQNHRLPALNQLAEYISEKNANSEPIRLNFICTHNSRRSHLSQIWAQCMAFYHGIYTLQSYSGGTESTAVFPMIISTLKNCGFHIHLLSPSDNPIYEIKYSENEHPILAFSKKMDSVINPKTEFVAIMNCSSADEACPFVPGAELRIPIRYEDPKLFDGTDEQADKYEERSREIATELLYVFSQVKKANA